MIYIVKIFIILPHNIIDNNMGKREVDFIRKIAKGLGHTVNDKIKSGGSGRSYRVGISVEELLEMFPDDKTARVWFENVMWPDGPCALDVIPVAMSTYRHTKVYRIDAPDASVTLA